MKRFKLIISILVLIGGLSSCASVQVNTDYDEAVDFDQYKSYAFYKPGIDSANISDLDKRRILRAIDSSMTKKGFKKSNDPDMLISIFTDAQENVNVHRNYYGWGYYDPWYWGYGPYYGGAYNRAYTTTEGILYIDVIDAAEDQLIWQGIGTGKLELKDRDEKIERINKIVKEILTRYPPGKQKASENR